MGKNTIKSLLLLTVFSFLGLVTTQRVSAQVRQESLENWKFLSLKDWKTQKIDSAYPAGASSNSVFQAGTLGTNVWALYVTALEEQGFLHPKKGMEKPKAFGKTLPQIESQIKAALGAAMFEKMPWDIFKAQRYGRLVWESSEKMSLAIDRVYLSAQGWHALAWDSWNFQSLHPDDLLVKDGIFGFVRNLDWYVLRDDTHFLAVDPVKEQTLVGSSQEKLDFSNADFNVFVKLCRESIK